MLSEIVIEATSLSKAYLIYSKPQDRLKQMFLRWRKYYQEYWAVQNVDLSIRRGETVAIVGRNGSGKSTLLQMIAGTLQPNGGSLRVHGRVAPLLELGAGFNPEFTGRENIRLSAFILGLTDREIREREESIVEFSGISDFVDQPVKTYSSGMYARLAFAVAAHVDADILIVDEILAVGDAAFAQKCMRYIRKFREHGTILFVSHDTSAVTALCDRAIWMDKGRIRAEGSARDVSLQYQASLQEEADGQTLSIEGRRRDVADIKRDTRRDLIRNSDKRNEIHVFEFDPAAPSFGAGGGKITGVRILDNEGKLLPVIEGGEELVIEVSCRADNALHGPIVGFLVRDRLGQSIFGDNTFLTQAASPLHIPAGGEFRARFAFQMPYLPSGDYAIATALAEGTQADHRQHHWVDEALIFHCESSHVTHGLIGLPMSEINLIYGN
ncbi:ABC transporter ATP-binding protein [Rhizobium ruizarguesonis]|uniref:ABC transporter ATP-binding protein n=1 Tax=Rhizobium ruizarguesonis TaxID=2081791 RepID=UPI003713A7FE